jgi:vesicle coat complex subunit
MSINLFRKDANNKANPIIRALAVRTMSSLRVPKLNEYLVDTLKQALNDEDPYVRKTAVLSIPKIYEIAPNDPDTANLVTILENIVVKESNALVLANTIASLEEISMITGKQHIKMDSVLLSRILVAVNECMEWAQVFILDFLCKYTPQDEAEAEMIIDRIIPRLSHINPSVVFGAIKLMVRYLDFLSNEDLIRNLCKKLAPSIVSVVSFTPT